MKRLLPILFIFALSLFFIPTHINATPGIPGAYTADPQASYTPSLANQYYGVNQDASGGALCQKFKPSKQVIAAYIDIRAAGSSTAGATLKLQEDNGSNNPGTLLKTYSPPASFNDGRFTMSRFTADTYSLVVPNNYYWICLAYSGGSDTYWYADTSGGYNYGFLMIGIDQRGAEDFGFIIYTSNLEAISSSSSSSVASSVTSSATSSVVATGSSSSVASGAAPVTPTTSIKEPTLLTIADVAGDQGGSLVLNWKASVTTDIEGYKIFRSNEEKANFREVAKTIKTIVTYTDNTTVLGQKYYYFVRAYKTTKESASSNTVNGISLDNLPPASPFNFSYTKDSETVYTFVWDKIGEASDLAGYTFYVMDGSTVVDSVELPKELGTYILDFNTNTKLILGGTYTFDLVAKDSAPNLSGRSTAQLKVIDGVLPDFLVTDDFDNTPQVTTSINWGGIALVGGVFLVFILLIIGGIVFYVIRLRKKALAVKSALDGIKK